MSDDHSVLTERVGLVGVMALVVGNAISIPIFVLPGPLAGSAGPSVVLAALVAALPAAFVVLYNAQLGSAMPVAGGLYVYISRLTSPFWGFLVPFTLSVVTWASLLFAAIGFAEYTRFFVGLPADLLIYGFLVFVLVVNLLGVKTVARLQVVFLALLVAALATFVVPGAFAVDAGNYTPVFPEGPGPFAVAVVALFYPYLGFGLLTELGEEIDDPGRTIPIALLSGIVIVAAVYLLLTVVLVGVMPWQQLGGTEAAVAVAATRFLPSWAAGFVALGAIFAVLSTVNTTLLVGSRTVMRAARDGILPQQFARIHPTLGTPHISVLALGVPPIFLATVVQQEVVELSVFIALATLTALFFAAIALWNLPVDFPEHYRNATLRFRRYRGLLFVVVGGMTVAAGFWLVTLLRVPEAGLLLVGWFLLGYGYYRYRVTQVGEDSGGLFMRMVTLDSHEAAFAREQSYEGVEEMRGEDAETGSGD